MRFFLGIYKINRSLHLSTRLLKVYTEASWGVVTHKPSRWSQQHIALLSLCPSKSFPCWEQWTECAFQGQGRRHGASNCRGPAHGATGRHILSMTSSNKWVLSVCFRWWKCFGTTEYLLLHNTVYVLNAHLKVVQFSSVAQSCLPRSISNASSRNQQWLLVDKDPILGYLWLTWPSRGYTFISPATNLPHLLPIILPKLPCGYTSNQQTV